MKDAMSALGLLVDTLGVDRVVENEIPYTAEQWHKQFALDGYIILEHGGKRWNKQSAIESLREAIRNNPDYDVYLIFGSTVAKYVIPDLYGARVAQGKTVVHCPSLVGLEGQQLIDAIYITRNAIDAAIRKDERIHVFIRDNPEYRKAKYHAIDFETTGLGVHDRITVFGIASGNSQDDCVVQAVDMTKEGNVELVKELLRKILSDGSTVIAHNLKFELRLLRKLGLGEYIDDKHRGSFYCTLLAETVIDENRPKALETVSKRYGFKHLWKKQQWKTDKVNSSLLHYCGMDAMAAFWIAIEQQQLNELQDKSRVLQIMINTARVLSQVELRGISVDVEALGRIDRFLDKQYCIQLEKFYREVEQITKRKKGSINIRSGKQLQEALPPLSVTEKGNPQYKADDLIKHHKPVYRRLGLLKKIIANRQLLQKYRESLDYKGVIHTEYTQTVTRTGRLSSVNPNLQNIPRESIIRRVFVPRKRYAVKADYTQLEPVVLATISGDKRLQQVFRDGLDLHSFVASQIFGIPYEEILRHKDGKHKETRYIGKQMNLAIMYLLTPSGLFKRTKPHIRTKKQAQELIDRYFTEFSGVKTWIDETIRSVRKTRKSVDYFGRERHFPSSIPDYKLIRQGVNHVIQSTGNMIVQQALFDLHCAGFDIMATTHDDVILDMSEQELERIPEVERIMTEKYSRQFYLKVDVKQGRSLYYGKDV